MRPRKVKVEGVAADSPPLGVDAQCRIDALESALASAIDYLQRLPRIPATVEKVSALATVLSAPTAPIRGRARTAEHFTSRGIPTIRAELIADTLWLSSRVPMGHEEHLLKLLRTGDFALTLKPLPPLAPMSEHEAEWTSRQPESKQS